MDKKPDNFSLRKWYMDCVDETGNVFIGYSAALNWKTLKLNYSSILTYSDKGGINTKSTLLDASHPVFKMGKLEWTQLRLKTEGIWTSVEPPIKRNVFRNNSGTVLWLCNQPKAKVDVTTDTFFMKDTLGYTEILEMTVLPWQLPITVLRWGRFLSKNATIIWIIWEGPYPLHFVTYNGNQIEEATVTDDGVILNGGEIVLQFSNTIVIRNESIASTLFPSIPALDKVIPKTFLTTHERKWRSWGVLQKEGEKQEGGWAIHEVVKWGQ